MKKIIDMQVYGLNLSNFESKMKLSLLITVISFFQIQTDIYAQNSNTSQQNVVSQSKKISGKVSDKNGPIPGANINIKGSTLGTVTDIDGHFTILVNNTNTTLSFSYIGYTTQEVLIKNQSSISVVLNEINSTLDEVVVIGYVSKKKGEVTGSISTLKTSEIENTSNKDIVKSLSGKVPGLIVVDRGGVPGSSNSTLLIRGKSTLGNNSPLILIDGIQAGEDGLAFIAPQDIESLSILKDGAAAIYGARAANGVILVTTKRGKTGKPKINVSSLYTLSSFSNTPKMMSSEQFAIHNNEFLQRRGLAPRFTQDQIDKYASGTDLLNYPNTNFADLTFAKNSPERRTAISISGATESVNYFVSADNIDQEGVFKSGALKFKQSQIRSNLDIKLTDNFKLGVDLSGRFGQTTAPGVDMSYIYKHIYTNEPTQVGIYPNGLVAWGGENGSNPVAMSTYDSGKNTTNPNDLRGKFSYDWNLDNLIKGLSFRGFAGIRKMSTDSKNWYTPWTIYNLDASTSQYIPAVGYSQQGTKSILRETFWKFNEIMLNSTLHYSRKFADKHSVSGFIGVEQFTSDQHSFYAERRDFPDKTHPELFAGSDEGQTSYGTSDEWGRLNYFGSFSYDYSKKYYLDLTLRYDGSSNFGDGKQFGTFPGVALSWALNKESFMEDIKWIDALRLRASYAIMGNDRISGFQYQTRYNYGGPTDVAQPNYYLFGTPAVRYNSYVSANSPNENVTWETSNVKNLGINFSLFNNRLTGDANYFFQKRTGILITRSESIPQAVGLNLPQENLGKVDNYGWEFQLGWNDKIGELSYNIGGTFTNVKNKVVYLAEAANVPDWLKREGHSIDSYVVYPTAGIFRDAAQVAATAVKLPGTVEGEPIYIDTDNNGKIDANDRIRDYSSNVPQIQFGLNGGINYKNFDVNFLFQGQAKAKALVFFDQGGAKPEFVFTQRWTPENRDSNYPRSFGTGDAYSSSRNTSTFDGADLWYKDASFIRLKEVEVAYTFTKEKMKFGDLKLYVRGFNLLTFNSEIFDLGLDPEASGYDNFRGSTYPSLKSVSIGFNISF